jgi:Fur family ferric uptake transcriptional regulator
LLPEEILRAARLLVPGLALATVYRNLKVLADGGQVRLVQLPGQSARYEPADTGHHHHFQCRVCDRVFDILACPGELAGLAPPGFTVDEHALTLYGSCGECSGARAARRPLRRRSA